MTGGRHRRFGMSKEALPKRTFGGSGEGGYRPWGQRATRHRQETRAGGSRPALHEAPGHGEDSREPRGAPPPWAQAARSARWPGPPVPFVSPGPQGRRPRLALGRTGRDAVTQPRPAARRGPLPRHEDGRPSTVRGGARQAAPRVRCAGRAMLVRRPVRARRVVHASRVVQAPSARDVRRLREGRQGLGAGRVRGGPPPAGPPVARPRPAREGCPGRPGLGAARTRGGLLQRGTGSVDRGMSVRRPQDVRRRRGAASLPTRTKGEADRRLVTSRGPWTAPERGPLALLSAAVLGARARPGVRPVPSGRSAWLGPGVGRGRSRLSGPSGAARPRVRVGRIGRGARIGRGGRCLRTAAREGTGCGQVLGTVVRRVAPGRLGSVWVPTAPGVCPTRRTGVGRAVDLVRRAAPDQARRGPGLLSVRLGDLDEAARLVLSCPRT